MSLKTSINIRRADRDDLDVMVAWMEDPDFRYFIYGDPVRTPKQIRAHLIGMLGRPFANAIPSAIHIIVERDGAGPIGMVTLNSISWRNRSCSVDAYLIESARNGINGLIAGFRVFEYCFQELNMRRINAFIYAFNPRSWRLFEFSGAKREVVLQKHIMRDGKLLDMYGYGFLRDEWDPYRDRIQKKFKGIDLGSMIESQQQKRGAQETDS